MPRVIAGVSLYYFGKYEKIVLTTSFALLVCAYVIYMRECVICFQGRTRPFQRIDWTKRFGPFLWCRPDIPVFLEWQVYVICLTFINVLVKITYLQMFAVKSISGWFSWVPYALGQCFRSVSNLCAMSNTRMIQLFDFFFLSFLNT